jgi:hypothetical protein
VKISLGSALREAHEVLLSFLTLPHIVHARVINNNISITWYGLRFDIPLRNFASLDLFPILGAVH